MCREKSYKESIIKMEMDQRPFGCGDGVTRNDGIQRVNCKPSQQGTRVLGIRNNMRNNSNNKYNNMKCKTQGKEYIPEKARARTRKILANCMVPKKLR